MLKRASLILLLILLLSCSCWGQVESACKIWGQYQDGSRSLLSGAVIGVDGAQAIAVTNWHLFRERVSKVYVSPPDHGRWYEAEVLGTDQQRDLAFLRFTPEHEVVPLAFASDSSGELRMFGYAGGRDVPWERRGRCLPSPYEDGVQIFSFRAHEGDSGSPIVNGRGELVAVCWGDDGRNAHATPVDQVRMVYERICRGGVCQVPTRPRQRPVVPVQPRPQVINGRDGVDGKDGKDGRDGRGVERVELDGGGLVVVFTDGERQEVDVDWGRLIEPHLKTCECEAVCPCGDQAERGVVHFVLVADSESGYWGHVEQEYSRALEVFPRIRLVKGSQSVGTLPALVMYSDSTPVIQYRGQREVVEQLQRIRRGDFKL